MRPDRTLRRIGLGLACFGIAAWLWACGAPQAPEVALYLVQGRAPVTEQRDIDLEDVELEETPILSGDDIVAYDWANHEIEITADAYERIQQLFTLPVEVRGLPFVLCVGTERIYAGAFWTPLSSLSFDGVVIWQPIEPEANRIRIELGYPTSEVFQGTDPRSDPRIRAALEAAGKLR